MTNEIGTIKSATMVICQLMENIIIRIPNRVATEVIIWVML